MDNGTLNFGFCPANYRFELYYDKNPIALDDTQSWQLVTTERDVAQEAYQILVPASLSKLSHNIGDMWDSKKSSLIKAYTFLIREAIWCQPKNTIEG